MFNCVIIIVNEFKEVTVLKEFLKRKNITPSFKVYFIDALGAMAFGLFASLLIGTIFGTVFDKTGIEFFGKMKEFSQAATGPAMAVAIGCALKSPQLVLLSLCAVGYGANLTGGPLGTFFAAVIAAEAGKIVSKETKIDILVTPTVSIAVGTAIALILGPGISYIMTGFGNLIMTFTELEPFWMGILVSVVVGIVLTLPISSAALCASLGLVGLAGGAATAGCCAQMIGFAVMSFKENGWGGIAAQGLGTSMLQMGNIMRNPRIWIPSILSAAVAGPVATCIFKMENHVAVASGMGTCGLVGPIGVMAGESFTSFDALGIIVVCFVIPAILTPVFSELLKKIGWIKDGDLKLDL